MTTERNLDNDPEPRGPLAGLVVLEFDRGLAQYCGKLLADMGAEVIKIEPPGGVPARWVPPFVDDIPDANKSLFFWHYNINKRSVVLDLESEDARKAVRAMVGAADIILDDLGPDLMAGIGLGYEELRTLNERLIYTQITPFGPSGPWSRFNSSDLVQLALGGTMTMTGYDDENDVASYPIAPAGGQAAHITGTLAAIAVMGALQYRETTGKGQYVDVAAHDAVARSNEMGIPYWVFRKEHVLRHTARHGNPKESTSRQLFRCRDGKYAMCLTMYMDDDRRYSSLVEWLESRGLAEDLGSADYATAEARAELTEHIIDVIDRFCAQTDSDDLFHEAQARKLPWSPVNGPWDLVHDPHLRLDRGSVVDVIVPQLTRAATIPGAPYKFERTPWAFRRLAPNLGENSEAIGRDASHARSDSMSPDPNPRGREQIVVGQSITEGPHQ